MQWHCPSANADFGANKVSVATSSALAPKGATSGASTGWNCLYVLATHQESEASPNIVTGTLKFSLVMYIIFLIQVPPILI